MMSDDVQDWRAVLDGRREWAVVLGDCLDVLRELPAGSVDAVVTDPPYGMRANLNSQRFSGGTNPNLVFGLGRNDWPIITGDAEPFDPSPWLGFPRVVLFGYQHYAARLPVGTTLVWIKKADHLFGSFLSDADLAWMKGGHGVYCYRKQFPPPARAAEGGRDSSPVHPTQKPIGLMRWCLDRAKVAASAVVFDPFAGSGTTGVACLQTGRRFIGVEIDPTYHAIAVERLTKAAYARQPALPLTMEA